MSEIYLEDLHNMSVAHLIERITGDSLIGQEDDWVTLNISTEKEYSMFNDMGKNMFTAKVTYFSPGPDIDSLKRVTVEQVIYRGPRNGSRNSEE